MQTVGNVTRFDHVAHYRVYLDKTPILIIVTFDGEPDLWTVRDGSTEAQAIAELREYYVREWDATSRVIPLQVYHPAGRDSIMCI